MTATTYRNTTPIEYIETLTTSYTPTVKNIFSSHMVALLTEEGQDASLLHKDTGFDRVFQDILLLRIDPDEDAPPTQFAVNEALGLIESARVRLTGCWTEPHIATDGYGGLRFSWRNDKREVRAIVPKNSKGRQYLYWEDGDQYDTVDKFTAVTLASFLDRLYKKKDLSGNG